jgi:hypothetical protein
VKSSTVSKSIDPGPSERPRVPTTVPLRSFLFLSEAERAGVPQHRLDRRVRGAEAQSQNR